MENCITNLNKDSNGGHGKNALDLLPSKKSVWVVEVPAFLRKKRLEILAESIKVDHNGTLMVTIDKARNQFLCFASGHWCSFYTDE